MRLVRWPLALLAAATLVASPARAAPATTNWETLPYLEYSNQQMWVATNGSWTHAKVVNAGTLNPGSAPSPYNQRGLKQRFIWAAHCATGRQFVSFSKTIMAYGAPYRGSFELAYGPALFRPYESATLLINGTSIAHLGNTSKSRGAAPMAYGAIATSGLRAFQFGANTLTVRVQKAALPKGQRCTIPNRVGNGGKVRYIGVLASISLQFGAVLVALAPQGGTSVLQKNLGPDSAVSVHGTVNFQNRGPSAGLAGKVIVDLTGDFNLKLYFQPSVTQSVPAPFDACTLDAQTLDALTCTYHEFKPGTVAALPIEVTGGLDKSFPKNGVRKGRITWTIQSDLGNDPSGGVLSTGVDLVMCGISATDPVCSS